MFKFIKKIQQIVRQYDSDRAYLINRVNNAENVIRDRTDIAVNMSASRRDMNSIIIIGRYKNRDYIQTFSVQEDDLRSLVDHVKSMERFGVAKRIDCPPTIRAVFER